MQRHMPEEKNPPPDNCENPQTLISSIFLKILCCWNYI